MREFAKVSPQLWTCDLGRKIKNLGIEARVVSLYLLTNPSAHMTGVYYIPVVLIAHEVGLSVEQATLQLLYSKLRGGRLIKKTLDSAVANAETQLDARRESLKVHEVRVDPGPILRRSKPRSRGSSVPVNKRTSHFTIVVSNETR